MFIAGKVDKSVTLNLNVVLESVRIQEENTDSVRSAKGRRNR